VESKQKFIAQIMSSKSPVRSCDDVDETALSYAEIKALCAGNPLIKEKMELDVLVAKLRMLKADHRSQHYRLEDDLLKKFPEQISAVTARIAGIEKDIVQYEAECAKCTGVTTNPAGGVSVGVKFAGITIGGVHYTEKEPAAKALLEACKGVTDKSDKPIGEYMGFKLAIRYDSFNQQMQLLLRGAMTYVTDLGTDAFGNITRINNCLEKLPERLAGAKAQLANVNNQVEAAKLELEKPFTQEAELQEKEARLALLNADLNIDGDGDFDIVNDPENRDDDDEPPSSSIGPQNTGVTVAYNNSHDASSVEDCDTESRTGTYGKAKPSVLGGIRSFNSGQFNNAPKTASEQRSVTELN
jgi:hypothetical protein